MSETVFEKNEGGLYVLAYDEQFTYLIFWLSFRKSCSLRTWRLRIAAKNKGKLSTSQIIMGHHEKSEDPFFLF
jgi:hypothetical protein